MQIKGTTGEYSEIQFSKPELLILKKALEEMSEAISDREFETRVGASRKEVKEVLASIENLINSNIPLAIFKCLYKEVTLFNNALNEVLYGLGISNFELKVGKNEEAKILLKDVHKLMREMSLVRRKDEELNLFQSQTFLEPGSIFLFRQMVIASPSILNIFYTRKRKLLEYLLF